MKFATSVTQVDEPVSVQAVALPGGMVESVFCRKAVNVLKILVVKAGALNPVPVTP